MSDRKRNSTGMDEKRARERSLLLPDKLGEAGSGLSDQEYADWMDAEERKSLKKDRATRYLEINSRTSSPSPICVHPREVEYSEIIDRDEALSLLGIKSSELSKLEKMGVIRRAHPDLRAQFVYRDVAALATTRPDTPERADMQKRLRLRNTLNYMLDFVPQAYYGLDGEPSGVDDMDYIDRTANEEYQMGLADMSVKFRPLVRPVAYTETKDLKEERAVQFLYLYDEDTPKMTQALEMRRWYAETHPHTRYHVNRIAIPPLAALNLPVHEGVLKFLVQSASILYGIDLEVMPEEYYEDINHRELAILDAGTDEASRPRASLHEALTGARITDETELNQLLASQNPTSLLPLNYSVAAWYHAYRNLVHSDNPLTASFEIKRKSYVKDLMTSLHGASEDQWWGGPAGMLETVRQVEFLIGAHAGWASKYRPESPPAYIGQPPSYVPPNKAVAEPDPMRKNLHPTLRNADLPSNVSYLMGENSLEDATSDEIYEAGRVVEALDQFHRAVSEMLLPASRVRKDKFFMSKLFSLLRKWGMDPRSVYIHPIRDAAGLYTLIYDHPDFNGNNTLMEAVLPELKQLEINNGPAKVPGVPLHTAGEEVPEMPDPFVEDAVITADTAEERREEFVVVYLTDALGFSPNDMAGQSPAEILSGLSERAKESLDAYIAKAMNSEEAANSRTLTLE